VNAILDRLRAGVVTRSAEETRSLAAELALALPTDATLALHGDLGAGKTTFVQGLARGFGLTDAVTSPTFALFTLHRGGSRTLVHFDAYRLEHSSQVEALMLDEFLITPYCLAVEWPEKVSAWLPSGAWHLHMAVESDSARSILLS